MTCILSIDVGIKNLAMSILSITKGQIYPEILCWNVINVLDDDDAKTTCSASTTKKTKCTRYALYGGTLCKQHGGTVKKTKKKTKIKNLSAQDLCELVVKSLCTFCENNAAVLEDLQEIIIEKQPTENPKMLMQGHFVFCWLFCKFPHLSIKFVPAYNKLSVYDGPDIPCKLKTLYAKRKFLSIKHMEYYLHLVPHLSRWAQFFEKSNKKDDLSDCVLQGFWYLIGKKSVQKHWRPSKKRKRIRKKLHF